MSNAYQIPDLPADCKRVQHGFNGFRCKTLSDWLDALDNVRTLDRAAIAHAARETYSLEACGKRYDAAFQQIYQLYDRGWYSLPEKRRKKPEKIAV